VKAVTAIVVGLCGCASTGQSKQPRETQSQLVLHCAPKDAEVVLDSVPYARCKDVEDRPIHLARGLRHVEVRKSDHESYETWLDTDGTQATLTVTLTANAQHE